jgi:hypothetical protein
VNDRQRLEEWVVLLNDDILACLVEVAAVMAADQMGLADPNW